MAPKQQKKQRDEISSIESGSGLGNIILIGLVVVLSGIFVFYLKENKLFILLAGFIFIAGVCIFMSAQFFFYRNQIFFEKWPDAIRYSRYPATMIVTTFSMIAFIAWIKVSTPLGNYLHIPIFLAITLPFLFSSLCYGFCAYHTLIGSLVDKKQDILKRSGRLAIIYWKMGQIFLVSALVPMAALVVLIATYII